MYNYEFDQLKNECLCQPFPELGSEEVKQMAHKFLLKNDTAFVSYQDFYEPVVFQSHYIPTIGTGTFDLYLIGPGYTSEARVTLLLEESSVKDRHFEHLELLGKATPLSSESSEYAALIAYMNLGPLKDSNAYHPTIHHVYIREMYYSNSDYAKATYTLHNRI